MSALQSWNEERQSAWLYRIVAAAEPDGAKARLFIAMAEAAEEQAGMWEARLREAGDSIPAFAPTLRSRVVGALVRLLGPRPLVRVLAAMKVRGVSVYTQPAVRMHHPMPTSLDDIGRHHHGVGASGNLRAAVFGVNDGLVSNTALVMGMAGATGDPRVVLVGGVAGWLAGAFSMAAGEYISMRSQREMYEYQIGLEREELAEYPDEEAEELALIYAARGLDLDEARRIAREMLKDPEHALDTLAREELGLNPDDLGSPWGAAASSWLAFTGGALVPLAPFLLGAGDAAIPWAAGLAGTALFVIGAALSLYTGRGALWGGLRMLAIGGGAGLATWLIGSALGVALA